VSAIVIFATIVNTHADPVPCSATYYLGECLRNDCFERFLVLAYLLLVNQASCTFDLRTIAISSNEEMEETMTAATDQGTVETDLTRRAFLRRGGAVLAALAALGAVVGAEPVLAAKRVTKRTPRVTSRKVVIAADDGSSGGSGSGGSDTSSGSNQSGSPAAGGSQTGTGGADASGNKTGANTTSAGATGTSNTGTDGAGGNSGPGASNTGAGGTGANATANVTGTPVTGANATGTPVTGTGVSKTTTGETVTGANGADG
jgi:hypothetical protein